MEREKKDMQQFFYVVPLNRLLSKIEMHTEVQPHPSSHLLGQRINCNLYDKISLKIYDSCVTSVFY